MKNLPQSLRLPVSAVNFLPIATREGMRPCRKSAAATRSNPRPFELSHPSHQARSYASHYSHSIPSLLACKTQSGKGRSNQVKPNSKNQRRQYSLEFRVPPSASLRFIAHPPYPKIRVNSCPLVVKKPKFASLCELASSPVKCY